MLKCLNVVYKASCWDCDDVCIGKTKRATTGKLSIISNRYHKSDFADHVRSTGHTSIYW